MARVAPASTEDEALAFLERVRAERPGFEYEIRELHEVLPSMADPDAPVVRTTAAAVERVLGRMPDYAASAGSFLKTKQSLAYPNAPGLVRGPTIRDRPGSI